MARSQLSQEQKHQVQEQNAQQHRVARSQLSQEQRQQVQEQHAEQQRITCSQLRQQVQQQNTQQHRVARSQLTESFNIALQPITDSSIKLFSCGRRSHVCQYCHALKWQAEVPLGSICCFFGQSCSLIQLFPRPFPQPTTSRHAKI